MSVICYATVLKHFFAFFTPRMLRS